MKRFSQQIAQLLRMTCSVVLFGGVCLLAAQHIGNGVHFANCCDASHSSPGLVANGSATGTTALACTCDGRANEAVLTDRRQLKLIGTPVCRVSPVPETIQRFHNNSRPLLLRTMAVFCDFSLLRSILHPHFALIAHTSTVLC